MAVTRALSTEDKNLQNIPIIGTRNVEYSDVDLSFSPTLSGDLYKKKDASAVKQAVKNLLMTNFFEKPFMPFYGGNLNNLLFELSTTVEPELIKTQIITALETFEPRAKVLDIGVQAEDHTLNVYLEFQVVNTSETVVLNTSLSRLR